MGGAGRLFQESVELRNFAALLDSCGIFAASAGYGPANLHIMAHFP